MSDSAATPSGKIRCDACPVMCYIAPGQTGACDRYANDAGRIVRTDPVVMLSHAVAQGARVVLLVTGRARPVAGPCWGEQGPAMALRASPCDIFAIECVACDVLLALGLGIFYQMKTGLAAAVATPISRRG